AAKALRQTAAHGFETGIEDPPHVVSGEHVLHFQVADLGVHYDLRRGRDAAVVQVDDVAVDRERVADVEPEVLVACDDISRTARGAGGRGLCARRRIGQESGECRSGRAQESTSVHHPAWSPKSRGGQSCPQPPVRQLDRLKSRSADRIGRPTPWSRANADSTLKLQPEPHGDGSWPKLRTARAPEVGVADGTVDAAEIGSIEGIERVRMILEADRF